MIEVELFGMARALAGRARVALPLEDADYAGFVRALADVVPQLVPDVIDAGREDFVEPNLLLLDGRRAPRNGEQFGAADHPCVLFLASGG